ncbi:MAG: AAA family ATPase [Alphaproteobacteria bacterium]|nr:AAA family ATPase [Alphaproteobacteria bacterium]
MDQTERTGQAWSVKEERELYDAFVGGSSMRKIAKAHGRSDGAIASHLKAMGLLTEEYIKVTPPPEFAPTPAARKRKDKGDAQHEKSEARKIRRAKDRESVKIEINPHFKQALAMMEGETPCLFITGKAGTGKSTLLSHFCRITEKEPVVLAPTGVAALNVKGQTIHSFFNFYVDVTPQSIRNKKTKPRNAKLYKKLKTIVIDEISMVRADMLDCIDVFLRLYGPDPSQAFGGVQMIFIGDLYQLPPVVTAQEKELFTTHYQTPFFFSAQVMESVSFDVVQLEKVYRQKDQTFLDLLNKIRNNSVDFHDLAQLNERYLPEGNQPVGAFYINLTTTNRRADEINDEHLQALKGKTFRSEADVGGQFTKEYFPTSPDLQFKIGAQIMMLNNDTAKRWVNGSIGVIKAMREDEEGNDYLEVLLDEDQDTVEVYPHTWEVYRFGVEEDEIVSEPVGTFTQFPFRLAWAITIHKSQGKTFDHVTIDIGRGTFVAGQMYVALSRCTSFEGVILKTLIAKHHIRTDSRIFEFLAGFDACRDEQESPKKKHLDMIRSAISDKSMVEIVYLKGDDIQTIRTILPLSVGEEEYKGRRFMGVRAQCQLRQEERMFSVDRILKLKRV